MNYFLVVHYVMIMLMIMIFWVVKCSFIKDVVGLSVVLLSTKIKWKFKINVGVLNFFNQIIGV
jgi:hypothetical protein